MVCIYVCVIKQPCNLTLPTDSYYLNRTALLRIIYLRMAIAQRWRWLIKLVVYSRLKPQLSDCCFCHTETVFNVFKPTLVTKMTSDLLHPNFPG